MKKKNQGTRQYIIQYCTLQTVQPRLSKKADNMYLILDENHILNKLSEIACDLLFSPKLLQDNVIQKQTRSAGIAF